MKLNDLYAPEQASNKNDVLMTVKVPKDLRDRFQELCDKHEVSMSLVLRRFVEQEVAKLV